MEQSDLDASSRVELENGIVLTRCDQCRQMWTERNERGVEGRPPCDSCRVELFPENHEAAEVYMTCRRQYVTRSRGMDGDVIVDISIPAIKATMDAIGIRNQGHCLKLVQRIFHHFLAEREQ